MMVFAVGIAFVNYGPGHIGPRADPFRQESFLGVIIMATSAGDEEGAQRFGGFRAMGSNMGRRGADSQENAEFGYGSSIVDFHSVKNAGQVSLGWNGKAAEDCRTPRRYRAVVPPGFGVRQSALICTHRERSSPVAQIS